MTQHQADGLFTHFGQWGLFDANDVFFT